MGISSVFNSSQQAYLEDLQAQEPTGKPASGRSGALSQPSSNKPELVADASAQAANSSTVDLNAPTPQTMAGAGVSATKAANSLAKIAPQGYMVSAAYTVGTKIGPFEVGTKVMVTGTVNASAANKGDFGAAIEKGTLRISITLPGAKLPIVGSYNPSTQAIEWGKGIASKSFYGGNVILFGNVRAGVAGQTGATSVSGNVGVLLKVPGSEAISGALAKLVSGGTRVMQAGQLATLTAAGVPAVLAEEAARKIIADTIASGKLYVGVAYRGSVESASGRVTINGLNGSIEPEKLVNDALTKFAFDNKNFGSTEVAYGKNQWLTDRGTSYFQLSPTSENRNHGDPALELVNAINAAGRKFKLLQSRDGPEDVSNDGRKIQFVRQWQNVASGKEAAELLTRLKATIEPQQWKALVEQLKPAAQRLGVNFDQPELSGGSGPKTADDIRSRNILLRDYDKNSRPQEYREIVTTIVPGGRTRILP
jgi:hypothetical protein